MSAGPVWYAAYGSNLSLARLTCYLAGGRPPGAARTYPGARDPSPPSDVRPVELAGTVHFAWDSPAWGGGIAFYDPRRPGPSAGRAYRLTRGQLADVLAQEMHRDPGADLDPTDLTGLLATGTATLGPGRYETLHVVGDLDGEPVVTFTAPEGAVPPRAPTAPYLVVMGRGLLECGWTTQRAAAYLAARPGAGPAWTPDAVAALLA
ncbi:hypothetical protein GCM10023340_33720 [Nocardioides marinquilinus]|uniref:Histone deacetylase n=1 Tax=Nocardioides marinquilinus TaxID=1210400 RepID=A0ABP9PVH3_9ACTN